MEELITTIQVEIDKVYKEYLKDESCTKENMARLKRATELLTAVNVINEFKNK